MLKYWLIFLSSLFLSVSISSFAWVVSDKIDKLEMLVQAVPASMDRVDKTLDKVPAIGKMTTKEVMDVLKWKQ